MKFHPEWEIAAQPSARSGDSKLKSIGAKTMQRIPNLLDWRPGCPAYKFHLPVEEDFHVYQCSMTPVFRESLRLTEINMTKFLLLTSGRPRIRTQPSGFLGQRSFHLIPLLLQSAHSPVWLQTHATCPASKEEIFLKPNSTHSYRKHASCVVLATGGRHGHPVKHQQTSWWEVGGNSHSVWRKGSWGRMESSWFTQTLTQKPRHFLWGTPRVWAAPRNSILVKQSTCY